MYVVDHDDYEPRPKVRGDCENVVGPCPWVSCKYHLYLDVNEQSGSIKINFPDLEPWEIPETCALEVAEHGGEKLVEVGRIINTSRERIRQIEKKSIAKLKKSLGKGEDE